MATRWWIGGAGTQLWTTTTNWSATRGGASVGAIPANGDTVYVMDGNSQIQGSDQSAVSLANLYVDFSPYGSSPSVPRLSIGTNGVPLKFTIASGGTAKFTGGYGDMYLGPVFADATATLQLYGTGNHFLQATAAPGTGEIITGTTSGKVTIAADYVGSAFAIRGMGATIELAYVSSASPPTVIMEDGFLYSDRNLSTTTIDKGSVKCSGVAAVTGTISVKPNAVYTHDSSGTITLIVVSSGGRATSGDTPFTVTNATVYGDAVFFSSPGITYTNPVKVFRGGLQYDPG